MTRSNSVRLVLGLAAIGALAGLGGCAGYSLVPAATRTVGGGALEVTPTSAWNKLGGFPSVYAQTKSPTAEYWTADGDGLNLLALHGGLKDGATFFRAVDRKERPMPPFRASMTLPEIPDWVESSLRLRSPNTTVTMGEVRPVSFSGQPGVQFDLSFVDESEVPRRARGAATIRDGRLYLIFFEAVAPVYFDRHAAEVDRIIATARIRG